jgi:hypothetical protein
MTIFGLADKEMTWERFLQLTSGPQQESWREAITSVILSSRAERIDVDNSQIIVSSDDSKAYRIVLSSATKYWDDRQEFSLYFVESLRKMDYGDPDTAPMLKGLDLAFRYRSMFLDDYSEFSAPNVLATQEDRLPEMAANLLRELNLYRTELTYAGLDQPIVWSRFVDPTLIKLMVSRELLVRTLIGQVLNAKGQGEKLAELRYELSDAIRELEDTARSHSAHVIEAIATKLIDSVSAIAEGAEQAEPTGAALVEPVAAPTETAQVASFPAAVPAATRESGTPEPSATGVESVDTAVFCPPHVARDSVFLVQVFLYSPRVRTQVDMQARQADETAQRRATYSLPLDLPLGTRVDLHLEIPGLNVPEPDAMLVWRGSPTAAQFEVAVPTNAAGSQVIGRVRIAVAGVPAGALRFQVTLTAAGTSPGAVDARELRARRYRRAFVSYSSQDRAEVLRRVQAFRIAGLSVFQDILDLDPGERWQKALYREIDNCDVFLLFWSHAAAASEWVGKEIDYALARKRGDEELPPDIQPVPIEGPPIVPPPVSLSGLHFNDALLAQIRAAENAQYDRPANHDLKG